MESRKDIAVEKKKSGHYNCAQAVACTYCDIAGTDHDTLFAAAGAFGRGMGCMEGTCGAITGAGLVLGFAMPDRVRAMQAQGRIMAKFQERNGATLCRKLKGLSTGTPLRHCNGCVADAAEFLEAELAAE